VTLAEKPATQYRGKARLAFNFSAEHGAESEHGKAYAAEGLHWLRAARAADAGDTTPCPWLPASQS